MPGRTHSIHRWRKEVEAHEEAAFTDQARPDPSLEQRLAELERFCGQLSLENTILKKSLATYRSKSGTFRVEDGRLAPERGIGRRLLCRPKRHYRATTDANHSEKRFPNLLREVITVWPDQVWQARGDLCAGPAGLLNLG